jgi:hypothetical protein
LWALGQPDEDIYRNEKDFFFNLKGSQKMPRFSRIQITRFDLLLPPHKGGYAITVSSNYGKISEDFMHGLEVFMPWTGLIQSIGEVMSADKEVWAPAPNGIFSDFSTSKLCYLGDGLRYGETLPHENENIVLFAGNGGWFYRNPLGVEDLPFFSFFHCF